MMDRILIIMALSLGIFTVAMIVLFCVYQAIPDTLCSCFFTAFGAEGGFMAVIKVGKLLKEKDEKRKKADIAAEEDTDELELES